MRTLLCLTLALLSAVCFAAAPPAKVPAEWLKLIDQLGDDDTREQAAKKLDALGEDVLPILRRAAKDHTDVDVRLRSTLLITAIERKQAGELLQFVGHTDGVHSIAVSPDGKRLVSGSWGFNSEPVARVWDVGTGKEVLQLKAKEYGVHAVAWTPDGESIVTGGGDSMLRVWSSKGKELSLSGMPNVVLNLRCLPDGKRAVASYNKWVGVYDLGTGNRARQFEGNRELVRGLSLFPDGKKVVASGHDPTIRLFETDTGKQVRTFTGHEGWVTGVAASPDGKHFLSAGHDQTVRLWDAETGKEVRRFSGHSDRVLGVAWSNDGKRMVSMSEDKTAIVWDVASGKKWQTLEGHTKAVTCAVFLPGDRLVVTGSYDKTLRTWKVRP